MTLENTLRTRLVEPGEAGRSTVVVPHQDWSVAFDVERADQVGCVLWAVELRRAEPAGGDVKAWAERTAQRVTGLLETLHVLEVDEPRRQALLRSGTPAARETGVQYYEVRLNGAEQASVQRYLGFPRSSEKRQQVAFTLTYEALAKLVEDLAATK